MIVQFSAFGGADNIYEFRVDFLNNSEGEAIIPLEKMQRSANRVGLCISDGGGFLEPIAFDVVSYREAPRLCTLPPHGSAEILISAELKKAGASSYILVLDDATYKIDLGRIYEISFRMDEFESNVIYQAFEAVA